MFWVQSKDVSLSLLGRLKQRKPSPPRPSVRSVFITSVSDHTRLSVSIKLCSLWDNVYVRGQLIFSHCNYWQRSMKYRCSCHTHTHTQFLLPGKSVLTQPVEPRTTHNQSQATKGELYESLENACLSTV